MTPDPATPPPHDPAPSAPPHDPATPPPVIEFRGVGVRFGAQQVLAGLDVAILPHQTVCVIGESGCGKTVLLKLIVGLLRPTEGEVLFEGTPVHTLSEHDLTRMRLRVGFLFQQAALFDSLTLFDNVAFGLRAKGGFAESEIAARVRARLAEVGLPPVAERKMPAELSGGMRKRAALARALAIDPDVMLYDEPTTGLDPIMTDVINELILQTRNSGRVSSFAEEANPPGRDRRPVTSVVVTHELRTVRKCADRVVMLYPLSRLNAGEPQILYDGPPDGLTTAADERVRQFAEGNAGERVREVRDGE